jgi:hypothetical protein
VTGGPGPAGRLGLLGLLRPRDLGVTLAGNRLERSGRPGRVIAEFVMQLGGVLRELRQRHQPVLLPRVPLAPFDLVSHPPLAVVRLNDLERSRYSLLSRILASAWPTSVNVTGRAR